MPKLDLKKEYKELYSGSTGVVSQVRVPAFTYAMIDGQGAPEGEEAQLALQALFPVAYKIKFLMKAKGQDYGVMPLEGLWWADDMDDFVNGRRDRWKWTYMIMQPGFVSQQDFDQVVDGLKQQGDLPGLARIRRERLEEGPAAQILHIGPFSGEGPNIQKVHDYIQEQGGVWDGYREKHHEIYLSDLRKVDPSKMKVVLRQPFHLPS